MPLPYRIEIAGENSAGQGCSNAMASVAAAGYTVAFREGRPHILILGSAVDRFLAKDEEILVQRQKEEAGNQFKKKVSIEMKVVGQLYLLVDASSAGNIKPIQVIEALFSENGEPCRKNALLVNRRTYLRNNRRPSPLDAMGFDSEEAYRAASGDTE